MFLYSKRFIGLDRKWRGHAWNQSAWGNVLAFFDVPIIVNGAFRPSAKTFSTAMSLSLARV